MEERFDQYAVQAEFYDVVAAGAWAVVRPLVAEALAEVSADDGPVVDFGAGTGLGVEVIADAVPEARIVAVEPSERLRASLFTRLMVRPGLRQRVTVLPEAVPGVLADGVLPPRLGAVVAMNMLGHLNRSERRELWAYVGQRLAPGAPAVIGLAQPSRPDPVPDMTFADVEVRERRYTGGGSAEPTGPDTVRWRMWFRVYEAAELVDERHATYDWWTVDEPDLLDELRHAGLTGTSLGSGVVVVRR